MIKSLFGLVEDVTTIVTAPIKIGLDVTRKVTKPIADLANETVKSIKDDDT